MASTQCPLTMCPLHAYNDRVELCGLYAAVSNLANMLQAESEGDVVQTVLNLKKAQPHFIKSIVCVPPLLYL